MTLLVSIPSLMTFSATATFDRLLLFGHVDHAAAAFADLLEQLVAADLVTGLFRRLKFEPDRGLICRRGNRRQVVGLVVGGQQRVQPLAQGFVITAFAFQESDTLAGRFSEGQRKQSRFAFLR